MTEYTITRPLPADIVPFVEVMQQERHFLVDAPTTYGELVERWGRSMLFFLGTVDGQPAVLFALVNPNDAMTAGWVRIVALPAFRGRDTLRLSRMLLEKAAGWGIERLWTLCLPTHRAARHFTRHLGFIRCPVPPTATQAAWGQDVIFYEWVAYGRDRCG